MITPIDAPEQFPEEADRQKQGRLARQDSPLVRALGLAHCWPWLLDEGEYRSMTEIVPAEGMDLGQASRIARLVRLAPEIVEDGLAGKGNGSTLENLNRQSLPVEWGRQRLKFLMPRY